MTRPRRGSRLATVVGTVGIVLFLASAGSYAAAAQGSNSANDQAAAAHDNGHGTDDAKAAAPAAAPAAETTVDANAGTSGDPTQPQPLSNADENTGGANGQCPAGPYCSTRDGSASENGNGDGEAKGKPCAGCVGKADNKNPKGQKPGGNDKNKGYECDGNKGIGKGNPAHTGCTPGSSPTPTPTDDPDDPDDPSVAPTDDSTPPDVLGEVFERNPNDPTVLGNTSSLPFTGLPVGWAVLIAAGLMVAGLALRLVPASAGARVRDGLPTWFRGGRHLG